MISDEDNIACRICGNADQNILHRAREMFFGTRETFTYVECGSCGTLQLRDVPDLEPYYPKDYYSFRPVDEPSTKRISRRLMQRIAYLLRIRAGKYYCGRRRKLGEYLSPVGRLISTKLGRIAVGFPNYLKDTHLYLGINTRSRVLDVGSGAGAALLSLREFGFRDLTGVDPFVEAERSFVDGVRILKTDLSEIDGEYDLILANHSLEHVPHPRADLANIYRLLKPGHFAIIRIPIVAKAWDLYKTNWVQLDPPRHLFLFTSTTFASMAEDAGFSIEDIGYDSTSFQFWGSEQYLQDIPLIDDRSYYVDPDRSIFSAEKIVEFEVQARELNRLGKGDQAVFYLRKRVADV